MNKKVVEQKKVSIESFFFCNVDMFKKCIGGIFFVEKVEEDVLKVIIEKEEENVYYEKEF